ncbi:hypothetical protein DENSPDRAFT_932246 [Dentipellis sp. KUC8613]|nr:hypothetical protein DENSPDRAFT_932246 [Dentipellis sp. KUC8613]
MNDVDMTYEDSTFICPPGDHPPTEGSIAVAQEALVAAFASAPEESLLPDSPDHPSSIYQPSPQPSPLAQPSFETPRRAPLTRRKAKTVSSSISSAVETLMASGMDRLTAIEYASDDQEAHARRQSDESFFDAHDGPVAGPSRGTQSYRNSFHEALASSSSSSGSPYLFDHRVFGSEEWTDASSEAEPVPSSQYSSEADALDEHSVSADASGEEEESARYVSRKGKERAL